MSEVHEIEDVDEDPAVPGDLLDLHIELEDAGVDPRAFREAFRDDS